MYNLICKPRENYQIKINSFNRSQCDVDDKQEVIRQPFYFYKMMTMRRWLVKLAEHYIY